MVIQIYLKYKHELWADGISEKVYIFSQLT